MTRDNRRAVTASRYVERFDPVRVFTHLSADGQGFILDGRSPEPGADRFVYVGAGDCPRLLTGPGTERGDVNPALALREQLATVAAVTSAPGEARLPFMNGAVGYFGYESVRHFEPSVGYLPADSLGLPEAAFFLPLRFVVYDREEHVLTAVVVTAGEDAAAEVDALLESAASVAAGATDHGMTADVRPRVRVDHSLLDPAEKHRHEERVQRAKTDIERGELIQAVLSQRVVQRTVASVLDVYGALAALNPSPYMFMLNFGDFAIAGCSPELMVRSRNVDVSMHPIAGTRPRGASPEEDAALEAEMLLSEKERAEHVMLVDLARNDLGRVCEPGTVKVGSFMLTERYSHVMHLVSKVKGRLRNGSDGLDAFVAGFPLGTLTGAPRLRAVELIAELEQEGRGPYCGGVGWFDSNGDVDTGTVIRCVVMRNGEAHVQGGGGVVFDSDPEREYLESVHKMAAQLEAIDVAAGRGMEVAGRATGVNG